MKTIVHVMLSLLVVGAVSSVDAEVLYKVDAATNNYSIRALVTNASGNLEIGDEVNLAVAEETTTISRIQFDYIAHVPEGQSRSAVLRVYAIDGADWDIGPKVIRTPGEPLYESAPFQVLDGHYSVNVPLPSISVPKTIVWAVEFRGFALNNTDNASLLVTDIANPSIGSSYSDYWTNAGATGWSLYNTSPHVANFVGAVYR